MDFHLNDVHKLMEETAEKFSQKEIGAWLESGGDIRKMIPKMGEVGLFGCAFPHRYGGSQAGFLAHSVV
ncbi:MAG: acyl-CoA dehydrogenase family protein, partial [Desulfobacterales bacterium]